MSQSYHSNLFRTVVIIDDNLSRSKIWINALSQDFRSIQHYYSIDAATEELGLSSINHNKPVLWLLDEYFYNHPIAKRDIKALKKFKGVDDLFISISSRPRHTSYFDFEVGAIPRSWTELAKELLG